MATAILEPEKDVASRRRGPLPGATLWLACAFAVTALGFWPTTFGQFGPPGPLRAVHGGFAIGWMGMLVGQAWLIDRGHRRAHRWVGWASLVVAPGLVTSAFLVLHDSLAHGSVAHFSRRTLIILTWLDIWSLLTFAGLYVAAILYRRRTFVHARLLASTMFVALPPAIGRLYGMNLPALHGILGALHPAMWTCEAGLALLALVDVRGGRWTSPWWIAFAALAAMDMTMFAAPGFAWFVRLLEAIGLPAVAG